MKPTQAPRRMLRSPHAWVWGTAIVLAAMQACGGQTEADDDPFGGGGGPKRDGGGGGGSSSGGGGGGGGGSSGGSSSGSTGLALVQLSTLANHTCAVWSDGKLKCWGNNRAGQLGLGDTENRGDDPGEMGEALPFVDVGEGHIVKRVATAFTFTCALLEDATVKCWGKNLEFCGAASDENCGIGLGDKKGRGGAPGEMGNALPVVDLGAPAKDVTCGSFSCCALLSNDSIKCWGENFEGVLGYGDELARGNAPGQMGNDLPPVDVGVSGVSSIKMGNELSGQHACAVLKDGSLKCWGGNFYGQLGIGDTATRGDQSAEMGTALPAVATGELVSEVALGDSSTCALLSSGGLRCWGVNDYGQLGYGDKLARGGAGGVNFPLVNVGGSVTSIGQAGQNSSAASHTCAVLSDGRVKCWGSNDYPSADGGVATPVGRLGYGDTLSRGSAPNQMGGNLPALDLGSVGSPVQVVVGTGHSCVRFDDNKVKCWGESFSGALGLGDEQSRGHTPAQMGDGLPFVDLGR